MSYLLERTPHAVFTLTYHLVWCVKYRRAVLTDEIDLFLKDTLRQTAQSIDIKILDLETDRDHVHVLFSCKPSHQLSQVVNSLKAVSARQLFRRFPALKQKLWKGHLWSPAYFIATTGQTTLETVKHYVASQKAQ